MASKGLTLKLKRLLRGNSDSCDALCESPSSSSNPSYGTFSLEDGIEHPGIGGLFVRISNELMHHHYHNQRQIVRAMEILFYLASHFERFQILKTGQRHAKKKHFVEMLFSYL